MKKHFLILQVCLVGLLGSVCSGCKSRMDINKPEGIYFQIIKFTNPEYANYVLASPVWNSKSDTLRVFPYIKTCESISVGKYPYIDLGDGYFLTRWWTSGTMSLSYDYMPVVINVKWENVQSKNQRWAWNEAGVIEERPFTKCYTLSSNDVDKYFGIRMQELLQKGQCQHYGKDSVLFYDCKYYWDGELLCGLCEDAPDMYNHLIWVGEQYEQMIQEIFDRGDLKKVAQNESSIKYNPIQHQ